MLKKIGKALLISLIKVLVYLIMAIFTLFLVIESLLHMIAGKVLSFLAGALLIGGTIAYLIGKGTYGWTAGFKSIWPLMLFFFLAFVLLGEPTEALIRKATAAIVRLRDKAIVKLLCNDQSQVVFQRYLERASNSIFRALATLLFAHQDESLRRSMVSALSPTV